MTREEYLNELETLLVENEIENKEEALTKYQKRFDLAGIAGMSEEETIEMLGTPTEVVEQLKTKEKVKTNNETTKMYNLVVKGCVSEDITVRRGDSEKIVINMDEELKPCTEINQSENNIFIEISRTGNTYYTTNCEIEILVGNNIGFDKLSLVTISGDINVEDELKVNSLSLKTVSGDIEVGTVYGETATLQCVSGDINVEQLEVKTAVTEAVSGDIDLGTTKASELRVKTTSGDVESKYVECNHAELSTISGDFNLTGKINEKKVRSLSGTINYYEVK